MRSSFQIRECNIVLHNIIKKPQILIIGLRKIINFTPEHL